MMHKYIRTKDRVYEVTTDTKGTKFIVIGKRNRTLLDYRTFVPEDDDIIAEADTIEELCDYLMFVDNSEKEDILITDVNESNITYSKNETCYACLKIKLPNGAIRIEPVAKFNEKWSFELI